LAHYFLNDAGSPGPLKLVPGGPNFELSYASKAVLEYMLGLSGLEGPITAEISEMKELANKRIASHEERLMTPLLDFLKSRSSAGVRILGIEDGDSSRRAPTISFVVEGKSSKMIAESFDAKKVFPYIHG
jgi:selenocysteine lyase/cysteine desulfurase